MLEEARWQALERTLSAVKGEPLLILIGGHPDPDAIGCALAHRHICARVGVPATIGHIRDLAHRENRALVKLLGVELRRIDSPADLASFKHISLVDASSVDPAVVLPDGLRVLTVVDHHGGAPVSAPFVDVRPSGGAASSIYAEYLEQGPWRLEAGRRDDMRVATAVLFGIQTDTDDFALATGADFAAAAYVKPFSDTDVMKQVGRRIVSAAAVEVLRRALNDLTVVRDFAFASAGLVGAGDRDAIGVAADFVLRREDIDTALVYAVVGERIDGSLRTNNPSLDPTTFLLTAFGRDAEGRPYGGGRLDKGGFQIPLGMLAECQDKAALVGLVRELIGARLARVVPELGVGPDRQPNGTPRDARER